MVANSFLLCFAFDFIIFTDITIVFFILTLMSITETV